MSKIDWSLSPPFGRRKSLIHALLILHARKTGTPLIVEIGTSESYNPSNLGNAMLAFAWYAKNYGARVKSCDIRTVENCRQIVAQYAPGCEDIPEFHLSDAIDFAATIHEPIGLLYMDALMELDADRELHTYSTRFNLPSFYVELYKRFDPACFRPGSLMLWDDTDPDTYFGKGMHLIPLLLAEGGGWRRIDLNGEPVYPMVLLERIS